MQIRMRIKNHNPRKKLCANFLNRFLLNKTMQKVSAVRYPLPDATIKPFKSGLTKMPHSFTIQNDGSGKFPESLSC